jgi:prepilin-type N-terminal cleavage/methylation domain-containing protein
MTKARILSADFSGFTLIEVLLAVSILSVGISQIFTILLRSASVVRHLDNRAVAGLLLEQELQNARDTLKAQKNDTDILYAKSMGYNPEFRVSVNLYELFSGRPLYNASMSIEWNEGDRPIKMQRVLYVNK